MAAVLKTARGQPLVGSNPTPSANFPRMPLNLLPFYQALPDLPHILPHVVLPLGVAGTQSRGSINRYSELPTRLLQPAHRSQRATPRSRSAGSGLRLIASRLTRPSRWRGHE